MKSFEEFFCILILFIYKNLKKKDVSLRFKCNRDIRNIKGKKHFTKKQSH